MLKYIIVVMHRFCLESTNTVSYYKSVCINIFQCGFTKWKVWTVGFS